MGEKEERRGRIKEVEKRSGHMERYKQEKEKKRSKR